MKIFQKEKKKKRKKDLVVVVLCVCGMTIQNNLTCEKYIVKINVCGEN